MKKILAAIDFSTATDAVVSTSAEMAKAFGAELHLIHVIEPEPTYAAYGFTPGELPMMNTFHEETRTRAQKTLDTCAEEITKSSGITAVTHLSNGSPVTALVDTVKEIGADFIVLGSHGHGVLASLLLGSVAEGMVRKSLVPTLVVPAGDKK